MLANARIEAGLAANPVERCDCLFCWGFSGLTSLIGGLCDCGIQLGGPNMPTANVANANPINIGYHLAGDGGGVCGASACGVMEMAFLIGESGLSAVMPGKSLIKDSKGAI